MEKIYEVKGSLSHGFVGQISYTVCLPEEYKELDIEFSFDKQHFTPQDVTPERMEAIQKQCKEKYQLQLNEEQLKNLMLNEMKTEIHTLATLNDEFIGCVHKQLTNRHMRFTADSATEGCIPQPSISGVLKVTVLVFNVLMDDTSYELSVSAQS